LINCGAFYDDAPYGMSPQANHVLYLSSKCVVEFIAFVGTHGGIVIAIVLLSIGVIFARSKSR
jgi:hypothetical protein